MEVTFEEARAHLGLETQQRLRAAAIARTPPSLLGLFSLVTLMANKLWQDEATVVGMAAWYTKTHLTFSAALAWVRRCLSHL